MTTPNPRSVGAVVMTCRRPANLRPVLEALRAQSRPLDWLTVIDATPPGVQSPVSALDLADQVISLGRDAGPFDRYVSLLSYRCDFSLFVDDDFTSGKHAVRRLLEVSELVPGFGVIGQFGRRVSPALEYNFADVVARRQALERVDVVIRGYFLESAALPILAAGFWRMPREIRDARQRLHDDILLCCAMSAAARPCYVYNARSFDERLIARALPEAPAFSRNPNHLAERTAALHLMRKRLAWQPLVEQ